MGLFIHAAIMRGALKDVQSCIDRGVDLNEQTLLGRTPLMTACKLHRVDVVTLLLNAGADMHVQDANGRTALFSCVIADSYLPAISLLSNGANVDHIDRFGYTALTYACVARLDRLHRIVCALLQYNADVNRGGVNGYTPLISAVIQENFDMASKFVEYGADPDIQDHFAHDAAYYVAEIRRAEFQRIIGR